MAQDKYFYDQLPLTKNMQTSDIFTGEKVYFDSKSQEKKSKNIWKLGAAREGINESEFALQCIYKNCLEKGYIT